MKQTVEEAAKQYANHCYPYNDDMIDKCEYHFESGAEWQAKQSPWISVEERLPENDDDLYIVLDIKLNPHGCGVCEFNLDINKWVSSGGIVVNPTHWMSIPSFDSILEANKDVLERIKGIGD